MAKAMEYLKASKLFGVSKSTLADYFKQLDKSPEELIAVSYGRKLVLSIELEESLLDY